MAGTKNPPSECGIHVQELLKRTYEELKRKCRAIEIKFPDQIDAEIANDSDWHRTREGFMSYGSCLLLKLQGATWAIMLGNKTGSYPGDEYSADIAAVKIRDLPASPDKIQEIIWKSIGSYFRSSIVIGLSDGRLGITENIGKKVQLLRDYTQFIAQKLETNPNILTLGLQPVVKKPEMFKPEYVPILAERIEEVLQKL